MSISKTLRSIRSAGLVFMAVLFFPFVTNVFAQTDPNPGDLILKYTASDTNAGNLTLYFTGTGSSGTTPLNINLLDFLTLGNGNEPFGTSMPGGIPGVTAGQGGLVGNPAGTQSPSLGAANELTNTSTSGTNGIYSQIFYSQTNPADSFITLDKTNPGVSDTINLGNVAAAGWSQTNLDTIFITDTFSIWASNNPGHFGYLLAGDNTGYIGSVQLQPVPEPSTLTTIAVGALTLLTAGYFRRRRFNGGR